jgi:hypothetical protein
MHRNSKVNLVITDEGKGALIGYGLSGSDGRSGRSEVSNKAADIYDYGATIYEVSMGSAWPITGLNFLRYLQDHGFRRIQSSP